MGEEVKVEMKRSGADKVLGRDGRGFGWCFFLWRLSCKPSSVSSLGSSRIGDEIGDGKGEIYERRCWALAVALCDWFLEGNMMGEKCKETSALSRKANKWPARRYSQTINMTLISINAPAGIPATSTK